MDDFDHVARGLNRISSIAQFRDKLRLVESADAKTCGNCVFWMQSRNCPRERNVGGQSRGPHSGEPGCSKFLIKDSAVALRAARQADAVSFARANGL